MRPLVPAPMTRIELSNGEFLTSSYRMAQYTFLAINLSGSGSLVAVSMKVC